MQRVGKKASFNRLSFAADECCMHDDGWRHDDEDYTHHDNDDGGCDSMYYDEQEQELVIDPNIASAKYLAARSKQKQQKQKQQKTPPSQHNKGRSQSHPMHSSSSSSSSLHILRPAACLRYYNRDPRTRILSSLDGNLLLHVATFLDLQSVAGWSCAGRLANEFLSSDALYCMSSLSSSGSGTCSGTGSCKRDALMLPCVKKLPYQLLISGGGGKSRPKGMARTMAHEADRIFGNGGVRNLAVAGHVRCKEEVDSVHLLDEGAIAIVTKMCEVEVHWVGGTCNGAKGSDSSKAKGRATKSSLKLPSCDLLLGSTFHAKTGTIALLSTVTAARMSIVLLLVVVVAAVGE